MLENVRPTSVACSPRGVRIPFIDEIHRFSKSQQDSLLGAVENGTVTLIGATTENPSFEVIRPLLSRAQVYTLRPLEEPQLQRLLDRAPYGRQGALPGAKSGSESTTALFRYSGGDARKLLNILDLLEQSTPLDEPIVINDEVVTARLQENPAAYDKNGEIHYDIISAFIKSIRGSDPDAAIYWLARMIEGGEDPEFIARRLAIVAAEDIGLANPNALLFANATFDILHKIGWPEGRIPWPSVRYIWQRRPRAISAYVAIGAAQERVRGHRQSPRAAASAQRAPTKLMKELGYHEGYKYAHDYPGNFVRQQYLPDGIEGSRF